MKYFYIHPLKKQYFFPRRFKRYSLLVSFFVPYSLFGKISWLLFRSLPLYRIFFSVKDVTNFIPQLLVSQFDDPNSIMAFNLGTSGPEQKITAVGIHNNQPIFVKYAKSEVAKKNVMNEHTALQKLKEFSFVPKVVRYFSDEKQVFLVTSAFEGNRIQGLHLSDEIFDTIVTITKIRGVNRKSETSELLESFSHGDFCPWNLMDKDGKILVYDWEHSGNYLLGYDLFTFIFQPKFILKKGGSIDKILIENLDKVHAYFRLFEVENWTEYLSVFADMKYRDSLRKHENILGNKYLELKGYAEKI